MCDDDDDDDDSMMMMLLLAAEEDEYNKKLGRSSTLGVELDNFLQSTLVVVHEWHPQIENNNSSLLPTLVMFYFPQLEHHHHERDEQSSSVSALLVFAHSFRSLLSRILVKIAHTADEVGG